MADLSNIRVTDGVDDVLAAQYNILVDMILRGAYANTLTMSGDLVLVANDYPLQYLNCNGANRIVTLPALASTNHPYYIINTVAATYTLTVKNPVGTVLAGLQPGYGVMVVSDSVTWKILMPFPAGVTSGPQAFADNYKIVVTVASNNLTVALKTISGSDPSVVSPVTIRIGDTLRTITAALSVTKNAATNWCNAGGAVLATKEIDYFIYLGYNATDGVVIGFSRIPFAHQYSDFSVTTTNEKYAGISTVTNAAATDYYEVIGRFAATLSAGAGYTWSVPTFTAINMIQHPIYETRTLSWVASLAAGTLTSGTGTATTVPANAFYQFIGQRIFMRGDATVTNKGTAGGSMKITPPFTVPDVVGYGQEATITGAGGAVIAQTNIIFITKYDATSPWTNTWQWFFQVTADNL